MAKATNLRTCVVEFIINRSGGEIFPVVNLGNVIIDLDKLKVVKVEDYYDFSEEQEAAQKILKKWKRSKGVVHNKHLKQWFLGGMEGNYYIEAHHIQEWFTKCEAK